MMFFAIRSLHGDHHNYILDRAGTDLKKNQSISLY